MKEELLQKALEYLSNIEAFAVEQTPIFIQELLNYHLASNLVFLVTAILLGVTSYKCCAKLILLDKENDYDTDGELMVNLIIAVFSGVFSIVLLGCSANLVKLLFAPRLFLIEELSKLL